jgi:hypothetical protein
MQVYIVVVGVGGVHVSMNEQNPLLLSMSYWMSVEFLGYWKLVWGYNRRGKYSLVYPSMCA